MKITAENYRGIEFVRISSLPEDQKKMIWNSFNMDRIIKILRDAELLDDCMKADDYDEWYRTSYRPALKPEPIPLVAKKLKLAFE